MKLISIFILLSFIITGCVTIKGPLPSGKVVVAKEK